MDHSKRNILLTTDVGVEMDDQWALAHLAMSAEFEMLGVVTTHSPMFPAPSAERTAQVARVVLDHIPSVSRPPVIAGSSLVLSDASTPNSNPGMDFIVQTASRFDSFHRLTVLMIGAATDVASALIADPSLADRIELVAMAFNSWPTGGDFFNVKTDPIAWRVVLESIAPITVGDAKVCANHLRMTRERAKQLFCALGEPGRYLADLLIQWLDTQPALAEMIGDRDSWPVWDEVTVAYLLGLTDSVVYRRPILREDLSFDHRSLADQQASDITWITSINSEGLWRDFTRKLSDALR